MGNDMFNDEQLKHAEIVQKETEDALGWWKERALKAEAERDALLSRPVPPADAATEAVRETLRWLDLLTPCCEMFNHHKADRHKATEQCPIEARYKAWRTALSTPAPAPSAKETR